MWDRQRTFTTLKAWATALHPDCECSAELKPAIAEIAKPRVTFAPALILGKRTQIGMVRIYDAIINRVASGDEDIPAAWTGLVDANPGEHAAAIKREEEFPFTGGEGQPLCHHRQRLGPRRVRPFGELFVQLMDPGVGDGAAAALEPVQYLRGRVDLVVVFAVGKAVSSARYWPSHGALFGTCTKPFSIIAVCACRRMICRSAGGSG